MASVRLTGTQHTSTPHLDGHLKGIRDEFDRLNHELDETRKQRDEYITKYRNQINELQELRQTVSCWENSIVCQHGQGEIAQVTDNNPSPLISPVSRFSEYHSSFEGDDAASDRLDDIDYSKEIGQLEGEDGDVEERDGSDQDEISVEPTIAGIASLSLNSDSPSTNNPQYSAWDVEINGDTKAALNLKLVHKLTRKWRNYLTFSMDGKYLATASDSVSIFDSKTGKRISVMKDLYHDEKSLPEYRCLCFSPDGKYLATGETDGKVRIWIISQRRVRNTFTHRGSVSGLSFSPNGKCVTTCSWDATIRIWRLRDGFSRILTNFEFDPWSVRFSTDGWFIASGCIFGQMLIWKVRTGKLVASWEGHRDAILSLMFTPDDKGLLSASWDKRVIHWDVGSLDSLGMADSSRPDLMKISSLVGHTLSVNTVSISPDGKWVASGSWDKTVRIWNVHNAILQCTLHCPGKVWSVDFSPAGEFLAIGGDFDDISIWNYSN